MGRGVVREKLANERWKLLDKTTLLEALYETYVRSRIRQAKKYMTLEAVPVSLQTWI